MQIRAATRDDLVEVSAIYDHHARSSIDGVRRRVARTGPLGRQGRRRATPGRAPAGRGRRGRRGPWVRRVVGLPRPARRTSRRARSRCTSASTRSSRASAGGCTTSCWGSSVTTGSTWPLAVIALPERGQRAAAPRVRVHRGRGAARGGLEVRRRGSTRRTGCCASARRRPPHDDPAERAPGDPGRRHRPRVPALGAPARGGGDEDAHRRRAGRGDVGVGGGRGVADGGGRPTGGLAVAGRPGGRAGAEGRPPGVAGRAAARGGRPAGGAALGGAHQGGGRRHRRAARAPRPGVVVRRPGRGRRSTSSTATPSAAPRTSPPRSAARPRRSRPTSASSRSSD